VLPDQLDHKELRAFKGKWGLLVYQVLQVYQASLELLVLKVRMGSRVPKVLPDRLTRVQENHQ
jgi:hypothetical protein